MKQYLPQVSASRSEAQRPDIFAVRKSNGISGRLLLHSACDMVAKRSILILILLAGLALNIPAMAQSISGNSVVCVGATTSLSCSQGGGSWSSSNTGVATVNGSGQVTGISAGTATIYYVSTSVSLNATMTVNALPDAGSISGFNSVCIQSNISLSASVSGGVWSAVNNITTVNPVTGVVTGLAIGSDTIQYTVTNGCGAASASMIVMVNGIVGDIYTYAGNGTAGFAGNNVPAYDASINQPRDLTTDSLGNVYFCDVLNNRVRKISRDGIITTVAGNGTSGNTGDGGQATNATLNGPNGVFIDNAGNIFISNTSSHAIRKVTPAGVISTIAGTPGTSGSSGDGGQATGATLNTPLGIVEDASGNIYIADQNNNKIRKITVATGVITTVAGTGTAGYSGDGGNAVYATMNTVRGITMDRQGNIYIADALNNVIRKYVPSTGVITTFAGTGTAGHTGDGGPATSATLTNPARFAYDGANILYITDQSNNVIRAVNLANGIINQVAGNASSGYSGDFGSAISGQLNLPAGIAVDHFGNFYIADANNSRIRVVPSNGSILSNIVGPTTICAGSPMTFSAFLSGTGSTSYQWQKNGANIGGDGSTYVNSNPSNGDVYRVIVTVTPACSSSFKDTSNNVTVTVNPVVSPISGANPICVGQTSALSDTAAGGTWTSANTAVATVNSAGVATGLTPGTSVITYALPNACGSNSANITLTVNALDTVMATAGANGTIDPSGVVTVCNTGSQTFTIAPAPGYHVDDVLVDGTSVGAVSSYTFNTPSANHTIEATSFSPDCVAPTISICPSDVSAGNDAGNCGAIMTYGSATADGTDVTITYSQNSGTSFPVGTTVVTVNATNSCGAAYCSFNVTVTDNENPTITAPSNITMTGYCSPITVSLGSATTADNCGVAGVTNDAPSTFAVGATVVTWTVTDVHGHTATATQTVNVVPATVTVSGTVANVSCYGLNDGGITTTVSGGTGSNTFAWSNGSSGSSISGAAPAGYSLTVTDSHGCSATGSFTITQPSAALAVSGAATSVACYGGTTGTVSTTVTGGTTPYTYSWNNGGTASSIAALAAGTYNVSVTDNRGCIASGSYSVTQPSAALAVSGTATSVACYGGTTGAVSTTVTGGTTPYTYSWNNGGTASSISALAAGTYNVSVTDNQGCIASGSYSVTQPSAALAVSGTATNVACYGGTTGAVSTTVTGGTSPYTYSWNNGGTAGSIAALAAGTYSVSVTDNQGCVASGSYSVTQPSAALSLTGSATSAGCYGASSGGVTTTVTGGTPSYTYLWSNGATGAALTNVAAGTYSVTVTDSKSCVASGSYTVGQPASAPGVSVSGANVSCYGGNNGSVTTAVSGGTSPYTYLWSNGATTSGLTSQPAGTYSVTVTDNHSCTATASYTIGQPSAALSVSGAVTNVGCAGGNTGALTASASGGTASYSYAWSNGATTAGISSLGTGTYSVTVTDAHSCTVSSSFTVGSSSSVSCSVSGSSSVLGGVVANFTAPAGMTGYSWSVTGGGASISGSSTGSSVNVNTPCAAGTYTVNVTVTNAGCSSTCNKVVTITASSHIYAYSCLYSTSDGHHPSVTKACLSSTLKVYDRHTCGAQDGSQSHYSSVWNGSAGQVTNCSIGSPETVYIGGGPAYRYTITVPAGGHYLVVGKTTIPSSRYSGGYCNMYTGQKAGGYDSVDGDDYDDDDDLSPCNDPKPSYHFCLQDNTGKCSEGQTHEEHGSLLLIVSPTALTFDDSVENLPVVYESVEGDWGVAVSADPPEGFYAIPADTLATSVSDSVMHAVQFYVSDTGSTWTNTKLTHSIQHKGASRTAISRPKMINERTNKVTEVDISPNPTKNSINIVLPRFEGSAKVRIYNMLGQKVAEKKVNIIGGMSVSMDVSGLVPGIYLVAVENSYSRVTSRLLKQ